MTSTLTLHVRSLDPVSCRLDEADAVFGFRNLQGGAAHDDRDDEYFVESADENSRRGGCWKSRRQTLCRALTVVQSFGDPGGSGVSFEE